MAGMLFAQIYDQEQQFRRVYIQAIFTEGEQAMMNFLDTPDIMSLIFMDDFFKVHAFHAMSELIKKTEYIEFIHPARFSVSANLPDYSYWRY